MTAPRAVAVVTGATGGIGRFIALGLARAGMHVVVVGRDAGRGAAALALVRERVAGASVELMLADLSSMAETRALGARIVAAHPAVSVLVNNAGVFRARRGETAEGHEMVLAVNHLSPFVLTRALVPVLGAGARVVTVGSDASERAGIDPDDLELKRGWNLWRAYARSKLAVTMQTFEWARRLHGQGVTVNVVHPGFVATGIVRTPGIIGVAWKVLRLAGRTEEQGAETPLHAALDAGLAGVTGAYFKDKAAAAPNRLALDRGLVGRVWAATERLVDAGGGSPVLR